MGSPPSPPPTHHGMVSQPTTPAVWSSKATTSSTRPAPSLVHQLSTSLPVTVLSSTVRNHSLVSTEPHPMSTLSFSSLKPRTVMAVSTTQPAGMLQSIASIPVPTPPVHFSWRMSTITVTPRTVTTTFKSPTLTTVTFRPSNLTIMPVTPLPSKTFPLTSVLSVPPVRTGVTNTLTMVHSPLLLVMPFSVNFSKSPLFNNLVTLVSCPCGNHQSRHK